MIRVLVCSLVLAVSVDARADDWWRHAAIYEVYPRSFADSNGDGIGDLNGITAKLDYLHELGIDAIWITPCFPSPQIDFGYDVSDYVNIDPMYGTLADFDRLVAEAKKRDIHVILDFVVNHTSDKHAWFVDSRSSKTAAHRDWYVWRDGKPGGKPPSNWQSTFGSPGWTLDPKTSQYYYHYFYPEQPDLNWRNPAVEKAMFDVARFWFKRGVAGFRLDAVDTLYEDPKLTDNPTLPGTDKFGRPNQQDKYDKKLPEVHGALQRLRKVADDYRAVLIGETWTDNVDELKQYYGAHDDELQLPMDLHLTELALSAPALRQHIGSMDAAGGHPTYVVTNHDIVRSYTRYGDGRHDDDIAKLVAAFYLTLRGTAVMYYGEELGMQNYGPLRKEDVKDPIGVLGWPKEKGRDGERTPMQWTAGANAGFSTGKPWLPVAPSATTRNVETESKDPKSMLAFYRRLLGLRKTESALRDGTYVAMGNDPNVLAYLRRSKDDAVIVVLNVSATPQTLSVELAPQGLAGAHATTLVSNGADDPKGAFKTIRLAPYGVYIAKLAR
jgi:alpha-glucosidase